MVEWLRRSPAKRLYESSNLSDASMNDYEEFGRAVDNLKEEILKALYIPQICCWLNRFWCSSIGRAGGC